MTTHLHPLEGNKLITKFVCLKTDADWYLIPYLESTYKTGWYQVDRMEFHSSWDWLIPVVEKIEGSDFHDDYSVIIDNCNCQILKYDPVAEEPKLYIEKLEGTKIEAVWSAVVQFIIEYNRNLKLKETKK